MISGIGLAILLSLSLRFGSIALSTIIEGNDPLSGSSFRRLEPADIFCNFSDGTRNDLLPEWMDGSMGD